MNCQSVWTGPDGIPPEVFKAGSQSLIQKFTEFLCMCWEDGCLPQDLKDARIVLLYKGKGDKSSCDNYCGISLLSIADCLVLSELVQVIQKRVNEETQKVMDLQSDLMAARRQNVELEKQLGRQGLDKAGPVKKKGTGKATSSTALAEEEESAVGASGGADMLEIMTTMEIQKDEIDALKAALQRTLQAKQDDLNLYSQTIDETKHVFLQALRQLKQSKLS
ncbi:hypothetical protein ACOMHN_028876 [Nucella lapillus]